MNADILLLQEVRGAEDRIYRCKGLMQGLKELGYNYLYWNVCSDPNLGTGYSGVAVISKVPIDSIETGFNGEDVEGRVLTARIDNVIITTVYSPCSQLSEECVRGDIRKTFDVQLREHVQQQRQEVGSDGKKKTVILMGDLNVARTEADCWLGTERQKSWPGCYEYERDAFEMLLSECGLTDVGSGTEHTWFKNQGLKTKGLGLRLVYGLISTEHSGPCEFVVNTKAKGSHHQPVVLELGSIGGMGNRGMEERSPTEDIDGGNIFPKIETDMFPDVVSLLSEMKITHEGMAVEITDKMRKGKDFKGSTGGCLEDVMENHDECDIKGRCVQGKGRSRCPYYKQMLAAAAKVHTDSKELEGNCMDRKDIRKEYVRMPMLDKTMVDGIKCGTLADTSSTYNLAWRSALIKIFGLARYNKMISVKNKNTRKYPTLQTATGETVRPIGRVKVTMYMGKGEVDGGKEIDVYQKITFFVMADMPLDFIIGCVHMDEKGWAVDFDDHTLRMPRCERS